MVTEMQNSLRAGTETSSTPSTGPKRLQESKVLAMQGSLGSESIEDS